MNRKFKKTAIILNIIFFVTLKMSLFINLMCPCWIKVLIKILLTPKLNGSVHNVKKQTNKKKTLKDYKKSAIKKKKEK